MILGDAMMEIQNFFEQCASRHELKHKSRQEIEKELIDLKQRNERLVNTIPCAVYDYIRWPDGKGQFIYISMQFENIFEMDIEKIKINSDILWDMVHPEDLERLKNEDSEANLTGKMFQSEVRIICPSGKLKWIQLTSMPSSYKINLQTIWSGVIQDITDRKNAEEERKHMLLKLQSALAEVKTLRGIIPICAYCKKIRDDQGYWNQVEAYVARHTEADFSHGVCPSCAKKHYPDFYNGQE